MDPDSTLFQEAGYSVNGTVTSQTLQTSAMLWLCAPSSPFHGTLVCFPSLASVITCLFFSVSSSVSSWWAACPLVVCHLDLPMMLTSVFAQQSRHANLYIFSICVLLLVRTKLLFEYTEATCSKLILTKELVTNLVSQGAECWKC